MPDAQLALPLAQPHNNQQLFSDYYLNKILPARVEWQFLSGQASVAKQAVAAIYHAYRPSSNEAQTEEELVKPILKALGHLFEVQPSLKVPGSTNKPDYVFYRDMDALHANKDKILTDQLLHQGAYAVGDAKYWERPLDITLKDKSKEDKSKDKSKDALSNKNPSFQIAFYMQHSGVEWGILTNGRLWRLYHKNTAHKLDRFYEIDLPALLETEDESAFLYFFAFFRRAAFLEPTLNLTDLLQASTEFARDIGESLKAQVYDALLHIAQGFLDFAPNHLQTDPAALKAIYDNSLIVLYRLLFILYAEDRNLLPAQEPGDYKETYSLHAIKHTVSHNLDSGRHLLPDSTRIWAQLQDLFRIIDRGSPPLKVATFNGGLFDPHKHPFMEQHRVGDARLQMALDKLTRVKKEFVDYRDLSPRHLGTIYEGLLEFHLSTNETAVIDGIADIEGTSGIDAIVGGTGTSSATGTKGTDHFTLALRNDKGERKATGSYYTPDYIVKYIVEETLRPLLERAVEYKTEDTDCIEAVLGIRVLDPAMGSGHFLVEATETIARYLVDLGVAPQEVTAEKADLAYWKRRVVQSCIYGVDLNPLAVELAKLSLWLTTVAKDRPLSFLDHHLRPGNTLIGGRLASLQNVTQLRIAGNGAKKISKSSKQKKQEQAGQISMLSDDDFRLSMTDAVIKMWDIEFVEANNIAQVKAQEALYGELKAELSGKYGRLADLVTATHFGVSFDAGFWTEIADFATGRTITLRPELAEKLTEAETLAKRYGFFHWELEFPEVFFDKLGAPLDEAAGFDAVVGNPPWERIKLQENEFFSSRSEAIALAPRASDRKRLIAQLPQTDPALWQAFKAASDKAEATMNYVHRAGVYPLMGHGDTNLYAVFAEKALQSVRANGRVGLLVPSGVATDDTTKLYFQELINKRRLAQLLDFENREKIFPDVDSRFKLSILIMTGEGDPQANVRCGFFLHNMAQLEDPERVFTLAPEDFKLFNPNTLTCPIFRRRRDMELTRKIYKNVPILLEKSKAEAGNRWGVSFMRMFDMTNDSNLFKTAPAMEADGFWLGAGNIYTKGATRYLPLYEGKLVQMFDHRAANIVINPENLHRPAQQVATTEAQYRDPDYSPNSQFWIDALEVQKCLGDKPPNWMLGFKSVTAPTNIRSFICAPIPVCGVGNSIPVLHFQNSLLNKLASCLVANLSSFVLDFAARQKIGGQNLNFFIVEQFPVLPPERYADIWHGVKFVDFITPRVLELCYTAHDLKGFADDMGYTGPPFAWNEERRLHLRCQLDALYFHLYGLSGNEAGDILETFPIVQRQDEARYTGRYRTRDLILAYIRAYTAGNLDAWVKG